MKKQTLLDSLRASPWLLATLIMVVAIGFLYPPQLGVLLWSLTKLSTAAYLGYWVDRSIFYYARPGSLTVKFDDEIQPKLAAIACQFMIRRAIIMAATILALGLGV